MRSDTLCMNIRLMEGHYRAEFVTHCCLLFFFFWIAFFLPLGFKCLPSGAPLWHPKTQCDWSLGEPDSRRPPWGASLSPTGDHSKSHKHLSITELGKHEAPSKFHCWHRWVQSPWEWSRLSRAPERWRESDSTLLDEWRRAKHFNKVKKMRKRGKWYRRKVR